MLNKIKLLLGISDNTKDNLLTVLIDLAISDAQAYTREEDFTIYESAIINMVVFNYNRLGSEGLSGEDYSGVSFSYSPDYPESIMRVLKKYRKVVFL